MIHYQIKNLHALQSAVRSHQADDEHLYIKGFMHLPSPPMLAYALVYCTV